MSDYFLDDTIKTLRKSGISHQWKSHIEKQIKDGNIDMAYDMIKNIYDDVAYLEYSLEMNREYPNWREDENN